MFKNERENKESEREWTKKMFLSFLVINKQKHTCDEDDNRPEDTHRNVLTNSPPRIRIYPSNTTKRLVSN